MSTLSAIPHVPRLSRVSAAAAARLGPPVFDPGTLEHVLERYGVSASGAVRNLRLGRRTRNVVIVTERGRKVLKCYRPQWTVEGVCWAHSILDRLHAVGFPAPRALPVGAGPTWTVVEGGIFALFDFIPGTNYSLNYLRRQDRLRLTVTAGRTLAHLHRRLEGFVPDGAHHLGFVSLTGVRRRDPAWHAAKVEELQRGFADLDDARARELARRLAARSAFVLDEIHRLDGALGGVGLPRLVIHGDYGLHNLIFVSADHAVPIDYELARLDWRVNDLISALGKHRYNGGSYDFESMRTLLEAYASVFPLTGDERRHLADAWRLAKLQAAVQYWNSYFETQGPTRKLESALDAIRQAEWVAANPGVMARFSGAAPVARPAPLAKTAPAVQRGPVRRVTGPTVMQVTPNLDVGGAQETVRTLASHLPRAGCRTVVCSFSDGPLRTEIEALGVPVELLPARRYSVVALPLFLAEMARRRRDLLDLVARHDVGVVQTQGLGTLDFLVATLRGRRNLQVWWTIQNANFTLRSEHLPRFRWLLGSKRAAHRALYWLGAGLVDGVVAVSDETARSFRAVVGDRRGRVETVCNAVDAERYPAPVDRATVRAALGFHPNDHVMTMVGTFKEQKGHRYLVEALALVAGGLPTLRVVLVGDGELAEATRAQAEAAGVANRVRFLGTRRDVPDLLAASDSFVLPSLWEGLPVALVEALAGGLPVIATAVSGTSQVMIDGVTGWLVPPGDSAALAAAMRELLGDPDRAARMAAAGRDRVIASFSARTQAERLAGLFGT